MDFFLELVTLIDIMLLGHWMEMRSILGASQSIEDLASLIPKKAHKILSSNNIIEVQVDSLIPGDVVLIRPDIQVKVWRR